jgi:hypothetical protein
MERVRLGYYYCYSLTSLFQSVYKRSQEDKTSVDLLILQKLWRNLVSAEPFSLSRTLAYMRKNNINRYKQYIH